MMVTDIDLYVFYLVCSDPIILGSGKNLKLKYGGEGQAFVNFLGGLRSWGQVKFVGGSAENVLLSGNCPSLFSIFHRYVLYNYNFHFSL